MYSIICVPIVIESAEVYPEPPLTIVIPESELLVIVAVRTASSPVAMLLLKEKVV